MKKKILTYSNIIIPIILFIILILTTEITDSLLYIVILTLFIGFIMPYIVLLTTGISLFNNSHHKMALILNIFNIFLSAILLYLIILIINKNLIILLIEYIIMLTVSIINTIYFIKYIKSHPNMEKERIKEEKAKNNGAIV